MPRPRSLRPAEGRRQLSAELRGLYGGALTLTDVMETIGVSQVQAAKNWIASAGLEAVVINGRKKWLVSDVARALDDSKMLVI
jgi:hypothetical protein